MLRKIAFWTAWGLASIYIAGSLLILGATRRPHAWEFAATWPYYASGAVCLVHPEVCVGGRVLVEQDD